jgi:hypothetical protein
VGVVVARGGAGGGEASAGGDVAGGRLGAAVAGALDGTGTT